MNGKEFLQNNLLKNIPGMLWFTNMSKQYFCFKCPSETPTYFAKNYDFAMDVTSRKLILMCSVSDDVFFNPMFCSEW